MSKILASACLIVGTVLFGIVPASGITFGQFDGNRHPNVGTMVVEFEPGVRSKFCSGTLIAPRVFLTAAHCTAALSFEGIQPDEVAVTFDPTFDQDSPLVTGTYHTDPEFGGGFNDWNDLAVVVLDRRVDITPARLPPGGLLDRMKADRSIRDQLFTAVGYGRVRDTKKQGPNALELTSRRHFVVQDCMTLKKSWIQLNMNPSTASGGTCFGDSGGPHFLGRSNMIVATTTAGDAACRATDLDYRLDTQSARNFLRNFVTLP